ncbi:MAG: MAPEG family protein [Lysobacterales bacterium]|nr:MAPEG family protein [Rhodanobacteraceae bacterium]
MGAGQNAMLLPILTQILLVLVMYGALQIAKARASKAGLVDDARRALNEDAWPDFVRQINNNIRNQFELPVLFLVLALILWRLQPGGLLPLVLAWGFVATRVVHAWIHTHSNHVPHRRLAFTLGAVLVLLMLLDVLWLILAG